MRSTKKAVPLLLSLALLAGLPAAFGEEKPLEALGALVAGDWRADDSRHVFEWGVGRKALRSRSYARSEGEWKLVSEGLWFWDPGEEAIRGVVVAIAMPVDLFEYRAQVRDSEVVHDLVAHGPSGGEYVERWVFGDGSYRWSLEVEREGKTETIMGGTYERAAE